MGIGFHSVLNLHAQGIFRGVSLICLYLLQNLAVVQLHQQKK